MAIQFSDRCAMNDSDVFELSYRDNAIAFASTGS
jgi:hypothetical protein